MYPPTLSFVGVAIFSSQIAALPTPDGSGNNTALLAKRHNCPPLNWLPIDWYGNDGKETDRISGVEIWMNEVMSKGLSCTYSMDNWNGKPANARMPMPGLNEAGKQRYDAHLKLARKLGKVLAEVQVDDQSLVVLDAVVFPGKPIWNTSAWIKFFSKDTGEAPSVAAFSRCVRFIDDAKEAVSQKMAWYAKNKGLLYNLDTFNFQTSVLFSDDLSRVELINWDPVRTKDWIIGEDVSYNMESAWLSRLRQKDLCAWSGVYTNTVTRTKTDVPGWCQVFYQRESQTTAFLSDAIKAASSIWWE